MIRNNHDQYQICQKHNLPLEFLNPDKSNTVQLYACNQCIIEYYQPISIKQIQQSNQKIIEQFEQQLKQNSEIWDASINSLISLKEVFIKSIKIIGKLIDVVRNQIQLAANEFQNVNINHIDDIKAAHETYLQSQIFHQRNVIQRLVILNQNISIDQIIKGLNEINLSKLNYGDQKSKINTVEIQKKQNMDQVVVQNQMQKIRVKKYEYQLIPKSSIKQNEVCYAISFNYDGSIIVARCCDAIKIFEFKNTQLKEAQSFKGKEYQFSSFKFMNKSNQFISGGYDFMTNIWQLNIKNKLIKIQTLNEKNDLVSSFSLIINQNDELIVSGSYRGQIVFWELSENKWQYVQQIQSYGFVSSLSFNDSNTKLISLISGQHEKQILVIEQNLNSWIISQKIQVETRGVQLCFINNYQFVLLDKSVQFYKFDQQTNKFEKQYDIQVSNCDDDNANFPIKLIKSKNLLIVKNCQFVHVLRQENFIFIKEQSIEFKPEKTKGDVSHDGNFMVTYQECEYEVRQLKEVQ